MLAFMSASLSSLEAHALKRIGPSDNDGYRPNHLGYLDFEAFEDGEYTALLPALDARITNVHYSLVSMLLAAIYFGLVVGHWLFATAPWTAVAGWAVPVGIVSLYAIITARNQFRRLQRLHEARAVVESLAATASSTSAG
jgi:hypothetical protein